MDDSGHIKTSDKYSLQGMVYDRIREDILNGVYKENDELREMTIGAELGVSRTPVREALRQLELQGLVKIVPNKGARVIGISNKDLKDIYEMRARLEGLCARWAVKNATEEDIARLDEICELSEFCCMKKKYDKVLELDNEFHEQLYKMADSKMLHRTMSDLHHYVEILRKKTLSSEDRAAYSIKEHRDIIDSIKAKDADKAEQLAVHHMKKTIDNIEEHGLW